MLETSRDAMWGTLLSPMNYSVHTETLKRVYPSGHDGPCCGMSPVAGIGCAGGGYTGVGRVEHIGVGRGGCTMVGVSLNLVCPGPVYPYM